MIDHKALINPPETKQGPGLVLATVMAVEAGGLVLRFDGEAAAGQKRYKQVESYNTVEAGQRVVVAQIGGSGLVLGAIGDPGGGGGGDVTGPAGATSGNFPAFADATGKVLTDSGLSAALIAAGYLPLTGGVLTGTLRISRGAAGAFFDLSANAGQNRAMAFQTAGSSRWQLSTNTAAESGSNAGSNFVVARYADNGDYIAVPMILYRNNGNAWFENNVSALSFTDRTPCFEGDALAEIRKIKGVNGEIDHDSLPEFARKIIRGSRAKFDGKGKPIVKALKDDKGNDREIIEMEDYEEPGRDLGAMVSILTTAVQQLTEKVEALEAAQKKKG